MEFMHQPVLLAETIDKLKVVTGGTYVDCTLGGGGHSLAILKQAENIRLIGIDQDEMALSAAKERLRDYSDQVIFVHSNFRHLARVLQELGIQQVDGIIMDIGISSPQVDQANRGFAYQHDAPLDMRMDQRQALSAWDIVNSWSAQELTNIFWEYAEERWAKRIAQFIAEYRKEQAIDTTWELVEIIKAAIPASARRGGPHPAKRCFQALRIAVNDELEVLKEVLDQAVNYIRPGGRLGVITFHSLEDRITKERFKELAQGCICPKEFPVCVCDHKAKVKIITRKPITASTTEIEENPRARSAKLRVAEVLNRED